MKTSKLLILSMLFFAMLQGCSEDEKGGINFLSDQFTTDHKVIVFLNIQTGDLPELLVYFNGSVTSSAVTLNGVSVSHGWDYDNEEDRSYLYTYDSLDISNGDNVNYSIIINGKSYTGTAKVPDQVNVTWPEIFDTSEDFAFSWTSVSEPDNYLLSFEMEHVSEDIYNDNEKQLTGANSDFRIPVSFFKELDENDMYFYVTISPLNYEVSNDLLFICYNDSYNYEHDPNVGKALKSKKMKGRNEFFKQIR